MTEGQYAAEAMELKGWLIVLFVVVLPLTLVFAPPAHGQIVVNDARFCGPPARDASGRIIRSSTVLRQFEREYPKPQDGRVWYRDHVIPLACGGCDAVINLQWLHEDQWRDKSKWERTVYGGRGISEGCP